MREPELAGQTVVLIGGSAGIGLETARRARAEGADVILTGRNRDRLAARGESLVGLHSPWRRHRKRPRESFSLGFFRNPKRTPEVVFQQITFATDC